MFCKSWLESSLRSGSADTLLTYYNQACLISHIAACVQQYHNRSGGSMKPQLKHGCQAHPHIKAHIKRLSKAFAELQPLGRGVLCFSVAHSMRRLGSFQSVPSESSRRSQLRQSLCREGLQERGGQRVSSVLRKPDRLVAQI